MIEVQNLTKKFDRFTALENLNLSFTDGKSIALIGPNGCGKTTLIKDTRKISETQLDTELLESFELEKMFEKKMGNLSGGTTQKVSAVLAFMFDPKIIILDEPTAGLDPLSSEILKEKIIKEKNKGKLIIITSHLLSELDEMVSERVEGDA